MFFDKVFETHCFLILSCFSSRVSIWLIAQPTFPTFQLSSPSFSTMFQMRLGLPHLSIVSIPWCVCTHLIDATSVHLLRCAHGNEHMNTHDVVCITFVTLPWDVNFHVRWK
jgi:hypothetical protein